MRTSRGERGEQVGFQQFVSTWLWLGQIKKRGERGERVNGSLQLNVHTHAHTHYSSSRNYSFTRSPRSPEDQAPCPAA
jgi:hypothetical protein